MRHRTVQNVINTTLGLVATPLLTSNPMRKSFLLSPLPGGPANGNGPVVAQVFGKGANQTWTVPNGVTQVVDSYLWGSGGSSGAAGGALGGGGGGGGGFGTSGPLTVIPGSVFRLLIAAGADQGSSTLTNPSAVVIVNVGSGQNGVTQTFGGGGSATTGVIKQAGGNGATAGGAPGAGGGGAGGNNAVGGAGAGQPGGPGGGVTTLGGFGIGGSGGAGGNANSAGGAGGSPGGGGGGGGSTTGAVGVGSDGVGVIFYSPSTAQQSISISPGQKPIVGQGTINYVPNTIYPFCLTDDDIGDVITQEWWAISGVAGTPVQVTEFMYDQNPLDLGAWLKKLAGW